MCDARVIITVRRLDCSWVRRTVHSATQPSEKSHQDLTIADFKFIFSQSFGLHSGYGKNLQLNSNLRALLVPTERRRRLSSSEFALHRHRVTKISLTTPYICDYFGVTSYERRLRGVKYTNSIDATSPCGMVLVYLRCLLCCVLLCWETSKMDHEQADLSAIGQALLRGNSTAKCSRASGSHIVTQGEPVDYVYLLVDGAVKISFIHQRGREYIFTIRAATGIFGAEEALLKASSMVTVTTLTRCHFHKFAATLLRTMLQRDPRLSFHVSRAIARNSHMHTSAMIKATSGNARQRFIALFEQQGLGFSTGVDILPTQSDIPLKKHEIAELLAITPEHLSRTIRSLKREGLLDPRTLRLTLNKVGTTAL